RIKGQLFGSPFERIIPLKKPDEVGKEGDPIGLERNHRYQLTITKLTGEDIEWSVQVADWTNGPDVPVKPTLDKPVLSGFSFESGGDAGRWDELTKTYTYDGTQAEVIRFTATGTHATTYDFHCELDGKGESIGMNNPDYENRKRFVKRMEPVFSYSTVSQEYEITLPTVVVNPEEAIPVHIKLYIQNQANYYHADTITIQCVPNYYNTQYPPVKVGGMYWAPVNVGATTTEYIANNASSLGFHFQWGRNKSFSTNSTYVNIHGPLSYENATIGDAKDKFILQSGTGHRDWLNPNDPNVSIRNELWSSTVNDSPCPKGWRVPTNEEFKPLLSKSAPSSNNRLVFNGDDGNQLYFPNNGIKRWNTGVIDSKGTVFLWCANVLNNSSSLFFSNDGSLGAGLDSGTVRTNALSLRCVQATTPTIK
ncbi:fibrobacter succinogenes major paralogous domain-containing protein, partial [Parabacteroides sp. OttesenSCG-928-G07]|nr:fibrobacter succinogenes major paralogous domain-containing protein [Parabacteroides sp. OttesenSCG-928-G07]